MNQVRIVWLAVLMFVCAAVDVLAEAGITIHAAGVTAHVDVDSVQIDRNVAGEAIFSTRGLLGTSGEPQIPWQALRVLLPPDAALDSAACRVIAAEYEPVVGVWAVAPTPPILTRDADGQEIEVWPADKTIVDGRDVAIYSVDQLWPADAVRLTSTGALRSWKLAELAIPLVRYNPVSGELQRLVSLELAVECDTLKSRSALTDLSLTGARNGLERARNLAVNFDEAAALYDAGKTPSKITPRRPAAESTGYLIVTSKAIRNSSTKLANFVAHKTSRGFTVTVIDERDIWGGNTPVAGDASATKLRAWLQANYEAKDLKYALIIGDPRTDQGFVPMKMYPCGDRNIPTDYFYAELTCDWDKNGNGIIGEDGEIERYFEVYVGRIPYYGSIADTDAILQKTIDYENSTDTAWRFKTLISNVPLDAGMHGYNWGEQVKRDLLEPHAVLSDRVYRNGYGQEVEAHPEIIPRPEFPSSAYPARVWSQGQYGLHIWSTHGWETGASGICVSGDAAQLDNAHPSTVFQGSCQNAYPENTGNLSYSLLKKGGIVTLGATRNSYYMGQTNFDNTPTDCGLSYRYAKGIVEGKSCGAALWDMKEEISSWWNHNWTLFNPYGDPSVVVMGAPRPVFQIAPTDRNNFYIYRELGSTTALQSRTYTLFNNRDVPSSWTSTHVASWFDVVPASGTIPANSSVQVNVSMNVNVGNLWTLGLHRDTISFVNTTLGITQLRDVECVIGPNDALRLYLPLNETNGTTVVDYSIFGHNGSFSGTNLPAATVPGKFSNAIQFDGVDDFVKVEDVNLRGNTITMTAWVKQGATQNVGAGIVFDRSSSASGLNVRTAGELGYHWNDAAASYNWSSGLTPPADTWTFVALVLEPTKATIYMNSGSGFSSKVNTANHAAASFNTTFIGRDPTQTRYFKGAIDEVRIYNKALTLVQLQALYGGGGAESPIPFDGSGGITRRTLAWTPGPTTVSNEVYVGTSLAAVTAATKISPEFKGATTGASFLLASLTDMMTYYWRVDTVTASDTLLGTVWSFTTGTVMTGDTILVNFEENSNQTFSGGALIGPTADDSSNWNSVFSASGTLCGLIDNVGDLTTTEIVWKSSKLDWNADGLSDDEHKMSVGYLDDGNSGSGKGVTVTLNNVPYATYKVYGLFASTENNSGAVSIRNFNVNGTWALGGTASTTASAWGSIGANKTANGTYWTEIVPGSKQGNYWTVETSGKTCSIVGEIKSGSARGSLTAVIIEDMGGVFTTNAPVWNSSPISRGEAAEGKAFNGSLAGEATDLDGDPLTFSKVDGPAWLSVAPNGVLSGIPSGSDTGSNSWTVAVTDGITAPVENTLNLFVVTTVEIENYSFELPGTDKKKNWSAVPGWSSDSTATDSGVENANATDGSWSGYLMEADPAVWNLTDEFIAPSEVYTLRVDANNTGSATSLRIRLYYDNAGSRVALATLDAVLTGAMQEFVLQYHSADVPAAAGKRIGIELDNVAGGWLGFDNIRLSRTGAADSDGDLIPDWWEVEMGLDPSLNDATSNSDSDSFDNFYEYVTDTDPKDANSYQTFLVEMAPGTSVLTLRFGTSARRIYVVEYRDDLSVGVWQNLGPIFYGTGSEMTVSDTAPVTNRFYRLKISLP